MKQISIKSLIVGLTVLAPIAGAGYWAALTINSKADAGIVEDLQIKAAVTLSQYSEITRRLDNIETQQAEIAKALRVPIISTPTP